MSRERSPSPILILDNGASTIKAGFAGSHEHGNPRCVSLSRLSWHMAPDLATH